MSLAGWLTERLGTPSPGRGCRHTRCIVCGAHVLAGLDEDRCALDAVVDPVPLAPLGEALALVEGRKTYEIARQGQGLALWYRPSYHISNSPASEKTIVMAAHVCGSVTKLPSIKISPKPVAEALSYDRKPPF